MTIKKIGNKVEVSDNGLYMYLPANKDGYEILNKFVNAEKYKSLFLKRRIIIKRR